MQCLFFSLFFYERSSVTDVDVEEGIVESPDRRKLVNGRISGARSERETRPRSGLKKAKGEFECNSFYYRGPEQQQTTR